MKKKNNLYVRVASEQTSKRGGVLLKKCFISGIFPQPSSVSVMFQLFLSVLLERKEIEHLP